MRIVQFGEISACRAGNGGEFCVPQRYRQLIGVVALHGIVAGTSDDNWLIAVFHGLTVGG